MSHVCHCVRIALCVIAALQIHLAQAISGQPGTLDATWATSSPLGAGKVITTVGSGHDFAQAMAVQPDGKVLLAGYCRNGATNSFCALRYNADGTLDTSFNSTGKIITAIGSDDYARAIALQPDGKVLLAGYCVNGANIDFCALRYNANGTLDLSFNGTGKVVTVIGSGSPHIAYAIAVQPDGKVLLAGVCPGAVFCALRYNADGTLDLSFNGTGKVFTIVSNIDAATAMALQPDGKVLLAGACYGINNDFCALRYHADGSLDFSFNGTGKVKTAIGSGDDVAYGVALQPDGKIVLAGYCDIVGDRQFCALRYHGNGVVDTDFGNNGVVITGIGNSADGALAIALQPDGKLLLGGQCIGVADSDFCVARYDGGPFGYKACSLDIDGDGRVLATTDMLIGTRIALGITGPAVVNGINFQVTAVRTTWPLIRDYLVTQCGMSLVP